MGRRKLIRKKSAGTDLISILIVGIIAGIGAVFLGAFKLIASLFKAGKNATHHQDNIATKAVEKLQSDPTMKSALSLLARVDSLQTFAQAREWDQEASAVVTALLEKEGDMTAESLADRLQEFIDLTPDSKSERKELMNELRQEKKALQLEKRGLNASMKEIRTEARQQSASAPYTLKGLMGLTALQRQQLRYAKEQNLAPLENKKDWIDAQLTKLERKIIWAQKFTEEAVQEREQPENFA